MKAQYAKITVQVLLVSLLAFLLVGCGESGNPGGDTGPGQTASISISSDAESLPANGEGSANLRLELSDAAGEPVDVRTSVSLHTNLGNFRGGGKESRAKTVDESGEVMVSFNAGTTPGKAEIWAESNGVKQKIEIMLIDPDKAGALTLDAGNEAIVADGSSQVGVFATVTNKDEPLEGVRVEFETTLGKFVSDNEAASQEGSLPGLDEIGESGKRVKAVTDGDGEARVMLESGTDRGVAMVTARIGGYLETTTIQFISGPPVSISLRAAPSTIKPYGTTDLIATLLDAHDNPVEEETINFYEVLNESGGSLEELTATTNVNGEAKVPYSAGTITGKDIIQAAAESTAVLTTTEITVDPEAIVVDSIEVTSGSSDLVADGSDETTILATVTDIDEEPAVGKTVEFTTTAGTLVSQSAETDENGIARVRLRSSTNTGPAKVRAKCDGFIGEREVEFIAGPADHILLYALPDVVPPNGAFEVVAGVMDQYDNRLMETERVTFKIRKAGESNVLDSAELTPDEAEDGVYRYDWTASYEADELEIMAETARGISETKTVRVEEGALIVGDINISSGTDRLDPDGVSSTAIRATVTDNNGDPASGITVDFSTTLGSLSETSAVTDANGIAEVSLIAGNSGGVATVTADANGFKARTEVEFLSSAAGRIIVNAVPGTIKPEGTTTIEAKVIDSKGNPIEGAPLNFDVYQNESHGGGLESVQEPADANGKATVDYTAGPNEGKDRIRVTSANNQDISGTTAVSVDSGAVEVGQVSLDSDKGSIPADESSSTEITAELLDTAGQPLPQGTELTFETTLGLFSNESDSVTLSTTDDSGKVTTSLMAGSTGGVAEVTAFCDGVTQLLNIIIYTTPPNVGAIDLSASEDSIPPDGTTSSAITADITNSSGDPVPSGTSVTFETDKGTFANEKQSIALETIGTTGAVTASLIADDTTGTANVDVTAGGVTQSKTIEFEEP